MVLGESADVATFKQYKYFKAKVLKPSVAEINAVSNHEIELIETMAGRWVKGVRFGVRKTAQASDVGVETSDARSMELIGELVKFGLLQSEAKKICASNATSYEDVKGAVEYTKRRLAAKGMAKVENPAAYLRDAISKKYKPESEKGATRGASATAAQALDIKAEYSRNQEVEAHSYFKELDDADQAALVERYNEQQTVGSLKVRKRTSPATEAAFFRWVARVTWGEPTTEELLEFAERMLVKRGTS